MATLLPFSQPVMGSTPSPPHEPPPPPIPSSDPRLSIDAGSSLPSDAAAAATGDSSRSRDDNDKTDIFALQPLEALQLLSASVELLVRITGDVPPTPPLTTAPADTQMSDMQVEKDNIARSHSEKNLAKMRAHALREDEEGRRTPTPTTKTQTKTETSTTIDGVRLKQETSQQFKDANANANASSPSPYIIVGSDSQPVNVQHGAITRRFYSRNEPLISVKQYLLRLYQFCPMSTAVYLATSLYIHRLAVQERVIPVTRRNAHRLVLAGLRVAMKALEDLSYSHGKVAKVGGVSEMELARLEINFCFLAGFDLVVGEGALREHWELLRCGGAQRTLEMERLSEMFEKGMVS